MQPFPKDFTPQLMTPAAQRGLFERFAQWLVFELEGRARTGGGRTQVIEKDDRSLLLIHHEPARLNLRITIEDGFAGG